MNCMQMIIIAFITAVVGALLLGAKQMAKPFDTTVIGWCLVAVGFWNWFYRDVCMDEQRSMEMK